MSYLRFNNISCYNFSQPIFNYYICIRVISNKRSECINISITIVNKGKSLYNCVINYDTKLQEQLNHLLNFFCMCFIIEFDNIYILYILIRFSFYYYI